VEKIVLKLLETWNKDLNSKHLTPLE